MSSGVQAAHERVDSSQMPRQKPKQEESEPAKHDVVLVHGRTEDGEGFRALRSRPGTLAMAELRPVREGQPLSESAELVRLRTREESPLLWDVEVVYSGDSSCPTGHEGPARVSSERYRENWERVFASDKHDVN